ncbi:unnamed protein product [Closterium sp. Naga37s-1]|nr:unnamed protein product [Closterium sp. Naga37s-1]
MGKSKTSGKGRLDKFYYLAKEQGYRSRAAFKLVQLNRKYQFLENSRSLLDLCAAPGGWLDLDGGGEGRRDETMHPGCDLSIAVAAKYMPMGSVIVGVDLVPIRAVPGCITLTHDITTPKCRADLKKVLKSRGSRGAFEGQSRGIRGAVEGHSRGSRGAVEGQSRGSRGAVEGVEGGWGVVFGGTLGQPSTSLLHFHPLPPWLRPSLSPFIGGLLDVVVHDGSPNVGGAWLSEALGQAALSLQALRLAVEFLKPGGTFISKCNGINASLRVPVLSPPCVPAHPTTPPPPHHPARCSARRTTTRCSSPSSRYASPFPTLNILLIPLIHSTRLHLPILAPPHPCTSPSLHLPILTPRYPSWTKLLFGRVEATKPVASRATSAEIYVVCHAFKAPSRIDPRLLDAKHLFETVPEPPKVSRPRYEEGQSVVHKRAPLPDFLTTDNAVAFLGTFHEITFDLPFAQPVIDHPLTTPEIHELCKDLRILGKRDFKQLLKWRLKIRKDLPELVRQDKQAEGEVDGAEEEGGEGDEGGAAEEGEEGEEARREREEAGVEEELAELRDLLGARRRLKLKADKRRREKSKVRTATGMKVDALGDTDIAADDELFALTAIKVPRTPPLRPPLRPLHTAHCLSSLVHLSHSLVLTESSPHFLAPLSPYRPIHCFRFSIS